MNPHFFTAPFYFAFIWFRVQGSGFRVFVAASPLGNGQIAGHFCPAASASFSRKNFVFAVRSGPSVWRAPPTRKMVSGP